MNRTREQRSKARRAWVEVILCVIVCAALVAVGTVVCAHAAQKMDKPREISEEYRWYLESQESAAPKTWAELAKELENEVEEDAEAPYESECIEEVLLETANRLDGVTVTHYCVERYPHICGNGTGLTASGREAEPGVSVAVDPRVIPLGSEVMVDYGDGVIHYYRADDTGGAVKGAKIDVCVETHEGAVQLGVRAATVWWIEKN